MAAGPWFTVRTDSDGWQQLDQIWISNGKTDEMGVLEYRSKMVTPQHLAILSQFTPTTNDEEQP